MLDIEIVTVRTRNDLKEFVNLPWSIYHSQDNWVPPLKRDFRRLLDTKKHPFWKFAQRELFIAKKNGQTFGRIAAIIDTNYNQYHKEKMGIWGFFECFNDPDVATTLFASAEDWVRSRGMEFIRGPLNPSTNYEVGLLVEGFEHLPSIMMPWNFPYCRDLVENSGYVKEKDLFTFRIAQTDPIGARIERLSRRILRQGHVSVRNISRKNYASDIKLLASLYTDAWSTNWGFVPMSDGEIREMGRNLIRILEDNLVFFVLYDGKPAGIAMMLPDMNPFLKQANGHIGISSGIKFLFRRRFNAGLRVAMAGVKKQFHRLGLPLVMYHYMNLVFRKNQNVKFVEFGWTLEDNKEINDIVIEVGAKKSSVYRIFRKSLIQEPSITH